MLKPMYEVIGPDGQPKMAAPVSCRYPKHIELQMLEAGYTIKVDGKRLTKTELRRDVRSK